jgi:hypothetical protein
VKVTEKDLMKRRWSIDELNTHSFCGEIWIKLMVYEKVKAWRILRYRCVDLIFSYYIRKRRGNFLRRFWCFSYFSNVSLAQNYMMGEISEEEDGMAIVNPLFSLGLL